LLSSAYRADRERGERESFSGAETGPSEGSIVSGGLADEGCPEDRKIDAPVTKERRGRKAGIDKIGEAIAVLMSRLEVGSSVSIADIAKVVGCTRKNLERSNRFMAAYRLSTEASTRALRHYGTKKDGILEGYVDPRDQEDVDEGDERDF